MSINQISCDHLISHDEIKQPKAHECEECVKSGDSWLHLRTCQSCGVTLCCDSSVNQHASKHAAAHDHPVVISAESGQHWLWCYVHKMIRNY